MYRGPTYEELRSQLYAALLEKCRLLEQNAELRSQLRDARHQSLDRLLRAVEDLGESRASRAERIGHPGSRLPSEDAPPG